MAKFVWYIVDTEDGSVEGTNNTDWLENSNIVHDPRFVVLHQNGAYYVDGQAVEVQEIPDGIEGDENEEEEIDEFQEICKKP